MFCNIIFSLVFAPSAKYFNILSEQCTSNNWNVFETRRDQKPKLGIIMQKAYLIQILLMTFPLLRRYIGYGTIIWYSKLK